jgi:dTDP-glucose pyrophosphorylase
MLQLVVPMAGAGSRFEKAGYSHPKPLIDVDGEPMISLVTGNLLKRCEQFVKVIYICQKEHYKKYDLQNVLKNAVVHNDMEIVQIDGITEGAACTALMAKDVIDPKEPLMIANSDQFINPEAMKQWHKMLPVSKLDGRIMTFKSTHPKWSYVRLDEDKRVIEVAEKKVISEYATTGIYWWKKAGDFIKSAESMIKKDIRYNSEFYIAPTYNEMILDGKTIGMAEIKASDMKGLGTPEDLNKYLK